jgi:chemotaxis protein histidine kinase CheA
MSATSQHGFHPDAESLNAFAEQALRDRERAEVLEHLGVCARCRQVVALARGAADASTVRTAARPRKIAAARPWWNGWQVAWVPAAALAATAALAVYVHMRNVERSAEMAKLEPQAVAPSARTPGNASHEDHAESVPPASVAPAPPAPAAKQEHSRAAKQPAEEESQFVTADAPQEPGTQYSGADNQIEVMRKAQPLSSAEAQQAPSRPGSATGGPAYSQPAAAAWETEQKQAEEQRQEQADASRVRSTTLKPAPAAVRRGNQLAPPAGASTDTVSAAPPAFMPRLLPDQPAGSAGISSERPGSHPIKPIHLPSGLAVVSSTSTGAIVVAVDKAGTLFLSEDRGGTWERVKTQWTGHAVAVRQLFATNGAMQSAPAAHDGTAPGASGNVSPAPPSSVILELFNDKNQAWVSTDGRIWTSK